MASSARINYAQRKPKTTQSVGTVGETVTINIKFNQINLQNSKLANGNLSQYIVKWSKLPFFVLMQEPATHAGRVSGLPPSSQLFATDKPRAAIAATPDLNIWGINGLTTSNMAACLWKTGLEECQTSL
jgi:hypothetical protein